jgi:hypothetical protein
MFVLLVVLFFGIGSGAILVLCSSDSYSQQNFLPNLTHAVHLTPLDLKIEIVFGEYFFCLLNSTNTTYGVYKLTREGDTGVLHRDFEFVLPEGFRPMYVPSCYFSSCRGAQLDLVVAAQFQGNLTAASANLTVWHKEENIWSSQTTEIPSESGRAGLSAALDAPNRRLVVYPASSLRANTGNTLRSLTYSPAYIFSTKCGLCTESLIRAPEFIEIAFLEGSVLSFVVWNKTIELWHLNEKEGWEHRQTFHLGAFSDSRGLGGQPVYHKGLHYF